MSKKTTHTCPCCKLEKGKSEFYSVNSRKSGRSVYCIQCTKDKRKEQAKTEKDKKRTAEYNRRYYSENRDREKARSYEWVKNNRDRRNSYQNERNRKLKEEQK